MSAQVQASPVLRPMGLGDLERVMEVERTIYSHPWTRGNFADSIRARYSCWVYEQEGMLIGYGVMLLAAQEAHLLNLSIVASWQGKGYGRRLLEEFMDIARKQRSIVMVLEVRPTNDQAARLYRRAGFRVVGVRPNYYPAPNGQEDAILMERAL